MPLFKNSHVERVISYQKQPVEIKKINVCHWYRALRSSPLRPLGVAAAAEGGGGDRDAERVIRHQWKLRCAAQTTAATSSASLSNLSSSDVDTTSNNLNENELGLFFGEGFGFFLSFFF